MHNARLRLGPENESLQNEADRSIFTSKFVFVLVIGKKMFLGNWKIYGKM